MGGIARLDAYPARSEPNPKVPRYHGMYVRVLILTGINAPISTS